MVLCFVRTEIIFPLFSLEIAAKTSNGAPIPNPNAIKLKMFTKKSVIEAVLTSNAAINAGLHGTTIAQKKKP